MIYVTLKDSKHKIHKKYKIKIQSIVLRIRKIIILYLVVHHGNVIFIILFFYTGKCVSHICLWKMCLGALEGEYATFAFEKCVKDHITPTLTPTLTTT